MESELAVALEVAEQAGRLLLGFAERGVQQLKKSGKELVSEADFAAQALIVGRISAMFPADSIVAEESMGQTEPSAARRRWFVDPLDGTTNFLKGLPRWGTSIAFYDGRGGAVGVVTNVPQGETYWAAVGYGAFLNGGSIRCSEVEGLGQAIVSSGFPYDFSGRTNLEEWVAVTPRALTVRSLGAAALDLCDVANGRSDGFWEQGLGLWDTAAGIVVAGESGALVTNMGGEVLTWPSADIVAANVAVHSELLSILRSVRS